LVAGLRAFGAGFFEGLEELLFAPGGVEGGGERGEEGRGRKVSLLYVFIRHGLRPVKAAEDKKERRGDEPGPIKQIRRGHHIYIHTYLRFRRASIRSSIAW